MIIWEIIMRILTGKYHRPYSEYQELKMEFQVIGAIMESKRPTLPSQTPLCFQELIFDCWNHNSKERPDIRSVISRVQKIQENFNSNLEEWSKLITKQFHSI